MPRAKLLTGDTLAYKCPGCKSWHSVPAKRWNWNGDLEKPTLHPSVRHYVEPKKGQQQTICHYHIKEGRIEYCNDCPHEMNGQAVDLPGLTEAELAE